MMIQYLTCNSKSVTIKKMFERVDDLKQFIEDTLHQNVKIDNFADGNKIPLIFQRSYDLFVLTINNQSCLLVSPKMEAGLAVLRKHHRRFEALTEQYCVFYLKNLNYYSRDKMLEEGIPFIWENHEIYMPFLGILLKPNESRILKPCVKISFLTQKFLLLMLYNKWQNITVTMAAQLLNVSKMSATRIFDEVETLGIPVLQKRGRVRQLYSKGDKLEMWRLIRPYMRSPLIQEFYLSEDLQKCLPKSGFSALCEYSMLNDNNYKTYAILKNQITEFELKNKKQIPKDDMVTGCIVQELGYIINYKNMGIIDPLTVLMLVEKEEQEPRVEKALDEMLRDYVYERTGYIS